MWIGNPTRILTRAVRALAFIGCLATVSAVACDPTTGQPLTTRLEISTTPTCTLIDTACYRAVSFRVKGSAFTSAQGLTVVVRAVRHNTRAPLNQDVRIGSSVVGQDGTFAVEREFSKCIVVDDPVSNFPLIVAAIDSAGHQRGVTTVSRDTIVCRPPFVTTHDPDACGPELRCTMLTTDNATTIGVHWDGRDDGYNKYRIRYGPSADRTQWITTRNYGNDVSDVAIRNLRPGVLYGFVMQSCDSPVIGTDDCGPWEWIGEAITA